MKNHNLKVIFEYSVLTVSMSGVFLRVNKIERGKPGSLQTYVHVSFVAQTNLVTQDEFSSTFLPSGIYDDKAT